MARDAKRRTTRWIVAGVGQEFAVVMTEIRNGGTTAKAETPAIRANVAKKKVVHLNPWCRETLAGTFDEKGEDNAVAPFANDQDSIALRGKQP